MHNQQPTMARSAVSILVIEDFGADVYGCYGLEGWNPQEKIGARPAVIVAASQVETDEPEYDLTHAI
jgi:hypothetical protein